MTIDQYAVIGNPIAHSKSPYLHTAFARQCQQALSYRALLSPVDSFEATVRQFIDEGGRGASVTLPFKIEAYDLCDEVTQRARAAAAVNTLRFEDKKIWGDNTDGIGLVTDIVHNANIAIKGKRILLLGAGGAARGVILPLSECEPEEFVIANRNGDKARRLVEQFEPFGSWCTRLSCLEFSEIRGQFDIIINATSASITGQLPAIPGSIYKPASLAYDLMYADQPTVFMQHAAQHDAQTRDGWGMLVEQAAEAFLAWRGVRPDTSSLLVRLK